MPRPRRSDRHLGVIAAKLTAVRQGKIRRLLLISPSRPHEPPRAIQPRQRVAGGQLPPAHGDIAVEGDQTRLFYLAAGSRVRPDRRVADRATDACRSPSGFARWLLP